MSQKELPSANDKLHLTSAPQNTGTKLSRACSQVDIESSLLMTNSYPRLIDTDSQVTCNTGILWYELINYNLTYASFGELHVPHALPGYINKRHSSFSDSDNML